MLKFICARLFYIDGIHYLRKIIKFFIKIKIVLLLNVSVKKVQISRLLDFRPWTFATFSLKFYSQNLISMLMIIFWVWEILLCLNGLSRIYESIMFDFTLCLNIMCIFKWKLNKTHLSLLVFWESCNVVLNPETWKFLKIIREIILRYQFNVLR